MASTKITNDSHESEITSSWPLPSAGRRFVTPQFLLDFLAANPLSQNLYPLAVGFYPKAAGHRMSRKHHDSYLMLYCTAGGGRVDTGSLSLDIRPGDVVILPRGASHHYHASESDPWTIFWIHYDGLQADDFTALISDTRRHLKIGLQPKLIADFEALLSLQRAGFSELQFIHGACQLQQLLTGIAALASHHQTQGGRQIDLDQVHEFMHMRIAEGLELKELAATVQLSKFHFARRFKQLTGHSPIQHFIHLKMEFACRLLDSSNDSVKHIATAVGYDDPYYFSRLFKQVIGSAPSAYRRQPLA
ncbi:MAG: AraC-like DNA-binding protein [Halieaceae bacterium]